MAAISEGFSQVITQAKKALTKGELAKAEAYYTLTAKKHRTTLKAA